MKVLVTGGAGYIGSTICSALEESGHTPIILDSLVQGRREFTEGRAFYQGDIADEALLKKIFLEHKEVSATIHCAALIVVPESVANPHAYFRENVAKSNELFFNLSKLGCNRIVFSSSASLYALVPGFMVTEHSPLLPNSPYARTKAMMEQVLSDFCNAYKMEGVALRYFNPIGADPKMRSGAYADNPSHVLGRLVATARGEIAQFEITGVDWPTRDGSGIRDYIHVWDLARAHVKTVENFSTLFSDLPQGASHYRVINLGSGNGVTVKELVGAFGKVWGKPLNVSEAPPRPGDVAGAFANADLAKKLLNWQTEKTTEEAIADALKWAEIRQSKFK